MHVAEMISHDNHIGNMNIVNHYRLFPSHLLKLLSVTVDKITRIWPILLKDYVSSFISLLTLSLYEPNCFLFSAQDFAQRFSFGCTNTMGNVTG